MYVPVASPGSPSSAFDALILRAFMAIASSQERLSSSARYWGSPDAPHSMSVTVTDSIRS